MAQLEGLLQKLVEGRLELEGAEEGESAEEGEELPRFREIKDVSRSAAPIPEDWQLSA